MPKIKIKKDRVAFEGKFISLIIREFIGVHGTRGQWEMVDRRVFGDVVAIAAVTAQNELIVEKIYRMPVKKYAIELPAGLADRKNESSRALARRELLEETGYAADKFTRMARGVFNAARDNDRMSVFLAENARKVREPDHENAEDITVLKIPLSRLYHFLTHPPKNSEVDLKLFGVPYLLEKHGYTCS